MHVIRQLLSAALFSISIYLAFDLFAQGFDIYVFAGAIVIYLCAYFLWPKKEKESDSFWLDIGELIIELPFRAIAMLLRGLGRALSGKGTPDVDIEF